jgi:hypothetical protein
MSVKQQQERSQIVENKIGPQFWIQDQAQNGGYFDSVGMEIGATLEQATNQLDSWRKSFPARNSRLIERTDVVVVEPKETK